VRYSKPVISLGCARPGCRRSEAKAPTPRPAGRLRTRNRNGPGARPALGAARVASEDGLEQEFNSRQAQREACEAFIASQRHEGWVRLPKTYDDGGFSGATAAYGLPEHECLLLPVVHCSRPGPAQRDNPTIRLGQGNALHTFTILPDGKLSEQHPPIVFQPPQVPSGSIPQGIAVYSSNQP
jgi:hypothetical protein